MASRRYAALLLDLAGTLLDHAGRVNPRNLAALREAERAGVRVVVATGRSSLGAREVIDELGLRSPTALFNGAAIWCPSAGRLIEERVVANRTLARALEYGAALDLLTVVMCADRKLSIEPRSDDEATALGLLSNLEYTARERLRVENVIRVCFLSDRHPAPDVCLREVEHAVRHPSYVTVFPLSELPLHRASRMTVVDVHAPCRGKAEVLRHLDEVHGIPRARVVAVGDGSNDVPMLAGAGLGVAMAGASPAALAAAERVIGGHETEAIAELVEELFLGA
jgi:Cof subfamily protein (haloacid dehalogenase superfamily)